MSRRSDKPHPLNGDGRGWLFVILAAQAIMIGLTIWRHYAQ